MTKEEFLEGRQFEYGLLPCWFESGSDSADGTGEILEWNPLGEQPKRVCLVDRISEQTAKIHLVCLGVVLSGTLRIDKLKIVEGKEGAHG